MNRLVRPAAFSTIGSTMTSPSSGMTIPIAALRAGVPRSTQATGVRNRQNTSAEKMVAKIALPKSLITRVVSVRSRRMTPLSPSETRSSPIGRPALMQAGTANSSSAIRVVNAQRRS